MLIGPHLSLKQVKHEEATMSKYRRNFLKNN